MNLWRLWAKSLGEKVGYDREADVVAIMRSCIILFNLITCCFIIANVIRHWDINEQGEVVTLKCYYTYHGIEHCITEDEFNESSPQQ
jgi:hypothetical protein|tara:strand:+ start:357 stop:617 length:261 start_codon:yes stop_codon:yes gene_type:complete